MSAWRTTLEGVSWVGRIFCAGGLFVAGAGAGLAEAGADVVGVVLADEVVALEAASFRPMAGVSCVDAKNLGRLRGTGRAVDEGGAKFAGSRGWFVGKYQEVVGDFMGVTVLAIVVVCNVAWLSAVIRGCRQRVLGVVARELVPDGADHGADPIGKGALTLSFCGVKVDIFGCR